MTLEKHLSLPPAPGDSSIERFSASSPKSQGLPRPKKQYAMLNARSAPWLPEAASSSDLCLRFLSGGCSAECGQVHWSSRSAPLLLAPSRALGSWGVTPLSRGPFIEIHAGSTSSSLYQSAAEAVQSLGHHYTRVSHQTWKVEQHSIFANYAAERDLFLDASVRLAIIPGTSTSESGAPTRNGGRPVRKGPTSSCATHSHLSTRSMCSMVPTRRWGVRCAIRLVMALVLHRGGRYTQIQNEDESVGLFAVTEL